MRAFENYHPGAAAAYFAVMLLSAMFLSNPIMQAEAVIGGLLFCVMLIGGRKFREDLWFYIMLFILTAAANPLFSHNGATPLFFLNGNPVTLEAVLYGVGLAATVVGTLIWCKCLSVVMTSDKLLYLFGKLLPKLSLVISMALRFIPMFVRQMKKVNSAQKAMGMYSGKSLFDRIKYRGGVFMAVISWAVENSMETACSMRARGYGAKGRSSFSLFKAEAADLRMFAATLVLGGITFAGAAAGATAFYYYPRITGIPASAGAVAVYAAFGALAVLPFIIEVKERAVWRYCVSKI